MGTLKLAILGPFQSGVINLVLSRDDCLFGVSADNTIWICDAELVGLFEGRSGEAENIPAESVNVISGPSDDNIKIATFSPDGKCVVSFADDLSICISLGYRDRRCCIMAIHV